MYEGDHDLFNENNNDNDDVNSLKTRIKINNVHNEIIEKVFFETNGNVAARNINTETENIDSYYHFLPCKRSLYEFITKEEANDKIPSVETSIDMPLMTYFFRHQD